jgi:hypothetical protein
MIARSSQPYLNPSSTCLALVCMGIQADHVVVQMGRLWRYHYYRLRHTCIHVPLLKGVVACRQAPEVGIPNHGRRRHGRLVRYQAVVLADVRSSLAAVIVAWFCQ